MLRNSIVCTVIASALLTATVAVTQPLPPGYVWGLANCGPAVTTTRAACMNCCTRAGQNGTIPATDVAGCKAMCQASVFPPRHPIAEWLARVFWS